MLNQQQKLCRVKPRDSQRSKVYRADDVLKPFVEPLPSVTDVQMFTWRVWKSLRVKSAYPKATSWYAPTVKDGRGRRKACAFGGDAIAIPLWARKTDVVIHELAHTIVAREYGDRVAGHGWEFCAVYLRLTLYMMGREAHDALRASFKANRVRFSPPRVKRALSPEQRALLSARLAAAKSMRTQPIAA